MPKHESNGAETQKNTHTEFKRNDFTVKLNKKAIWVEIEGA